MLQKKGRLGEDLAVKYLVEKGFKILERNRRVNRYEIDIIGTKEGVLYFFEVKSNFCNDGASPLIRIDKIKQKHLYQGAFGYVKEMCYFGEFEIMGVAVSVDIKKKKASIELVSCGIF